MSFPPISEPTVSVSDKAQFGVPKHLKDDQVSPPGTPDPKDDRPVRKVRLSKDLAAMADIDQIMCDLELDDQARVATWFHSKFSGDGRCPVFIKGERCALRAGHGGGHKWANGD